ncbi:hypothetical protein [Nocardia colli]|uniref:hypothetical protein n=1 Tax=Nocardia colli TaxID=2545717 RepID=UPI0035DF8174
MESTPSVAPMALPHRAGGFESGLLVGSRYDLRTTTRSWSIRIIADTEGDHYFSDSVYPWMQGVPCVL